MFYIKAFLWQPGIQLSQFRIDLNGVVDDAVDGVVDAVVDPAFYLTDDLNQI